MVLEEVTCNSFYFRGGCAGHERTDFEQFHFGEGAVVMKDLILKSFSFGQVLWS